MSFRAEIASADFGIFGKRAAIARFLVGRLSEKGYTCSPTKHALNASGFRCTVDRRQFDILVSTVADGQNDWLLTTQGTLTWVQRRLRKRTDREELQVLLRTLHDSMVQDGRLFDARWYTAEEWNSSPRNAWSPSP